MPDRPRTFTLIHLARAHQSRISIAQSTVRSQGKGTRDVVRGFLARSLDLDALRAATEADYLKRLDRATTRLQRALRRARCGASWGLARKVLNIYIRDCVNSRLLCRHYKLASIERFLEVPLDSLVGKGLRAVADEHGHIPPLPKWKTIRGLTRDESDQFQAFARLHARKLGIRRVQLDYFLWHAE